MDNYDAVFENRKQFMKRMNQRKFDENFTLFTQTYGYLFRQMVNYVGQAEDKEQAAREVGDAIVDSAKRSCGKAPNERLSGGVQTDLNMYMIIYVFTSIEKTELEDAKTTEDGVLAAWNERKSAGSDIGYIDYDKVYEGFKRKLFGII